MKPKETPKPTKRINLMPAEKLISEIEEERKDIGTEDQEEVEIQKEIENLSPKEKEKIGWGLSTIGFKVEKAKNDLFAGAFNKALKKIDKKGTAGRFFKEMRDGFVRDSKIAVKKAKDTKSGKEKHRLSNASLLFGNVLRYGRMITDLTGASLASPLRYVMMGGMATTRMAEAGKEARLKNEEVIEKTRIQDVKLAEEEAWKIYEKAGGKNVVDAEGNRTWNTEGLSAEALKSAYMMQMPKDLQKRLENPSTANTFIQKLLKKDIKGAILNLNKNIGEIENDKKLTDEERKIKIEKLITKQKKNLEDYDRVITQYGTIDGLAMAGRYAQTAGKTVVAVVTVETLALSVEKLFGTLSNTLTSHDIQPKIAPHTTATPDTAQTQIAPAPAVPETPPKIDDFINKGIKFEDSKGGIEGILDLKKQIAEQYDGDYSKAPENVQNFMKTDAIKQAIKLGLFDPNSTSGKESAKILTNSILKFDEKGNLLFGTPDTSEKIPILEKYNGEMFDSDGSAKITTLPAENAPTLEETTAVKPTLAPEDAQNIEPKPTTTETVQEKIEKIKAQYENEDTGIEKTNIPDSATKRPDLGNRTYHTGTTYETGTKVETGAVAYTYSGNNYRYQDQFPNLSHENNLILKTHPEFAGNSFNLSGEKLIQVYETGNKNLYYLFGKEPSTWNNLSSALKIRADEILKYTDKNPTTKKLSDYLIMLKNFTELEPKSGFLGFGAESSQHYIARSLQKLAATGQLEVFEKNLRQ